MPQNQEEIEAKLAAYIDGELDADGRAEIEKHLQANPQHRTLIADLTKQRELVRSLPRVNAPSEIAETLQGQLERSVLLGSGVDAGDDNSMRISPWPHRGAIAAIVLLTAGLSFLVYKVLPSSKSSPELAVAPQSANTPATLATEPPSGAEQPIASATRDRVFAEKAAPRQTVAAEPQNPVAASAAPSVAVVPESQNAGPASNAVASNAAASNAAVSNSGAADLGAANKNEAVAKAQASDQTAVALGPGAIGSGVGQKDFGSNNNTQALDQRTAERALASPENRPALPQWRVVVTTDNPAATDAQVRAFLIANQIHFEPVDSGALSDASTQPTTQSLGQPLVQALGQQSVFGAASTQPTLVLSEQDTLKSAATEPTNLAATFALTSQPSSTTAPSASVPQSGLPTTAPSISLQAVDASAEPATPPTATPVDGLGVAAAPASQPTNVRETAFFCPDVTQMQANDLRSILSLRAGQSARLVIKEVERVPVSVTFQAENSVNVNGALGGATTQPVQQEANANAGEQNSASQSASPQSLAAQSAAPQSAAPQSTAPQSTAPQSTAPQSTAPLGQQFAATSQQQQGQAIVAQQIPARSTTAPTGAATAGAATGAVAGSVGEQKVDLTIVMRSGAASATPQAAPSTQLTQPIVVPNSPSATEPVETGTGLKLP